MNMIDFFFFNDTATTEIYTLSLHDALPIWPGRLLHRLDRHGPEAREDRVADGEAVGGLALDGRGGLVVLGADQPGGEVGDRKSTRLNSSHANISYAVFCLKKKNTITI